MEYIGDIYAGHLEQKTVNNKMSDKLSKYMKKATAKSIEEEPQKSDKVKLLFIPRHKLNDLPLTEIINITNKQVHPRTANFF